ncbi:hypothetical protein [Streptomyces sp. NPDC058657]|uniref:hypothetical protein n=1 Tax=unclassified Streptomyces TaxID=2593676 RepID=UPI00364CAEB5
MRRPGTTAPRTAGGQLATAPLPTVLLPAVLLAAALAAVALLAGCGGRAATHHKPGTGHEVATGPAGRLLDTRDAQGHRLREAAAAQAPEVALTVRPDSEGGWNIQLAVQRFRFTPDSTGGAALPGSGHARLSLNGRELARLYGPWFHLPPGAVPPGAHTLTVRLHADDHTVWAVRGTPVEGTAPLTPATPGTTPSGAEPSGSAPPGRAPPGRAPPVTAPPGAAPSMAVPGSTEPAAPAPPKADRTVRIAVADGKVAPAPGRIALKKGQRIELAVVSDKDDTLHIHGYDRKVELPAGRLVSYAFVVDRAGLFEVETHGSDLLLTQLVVR